MSKIILYILLGFIGVLIAITIFELIFAIWYGLNEKLINWIIDKLT